MDDELARFCDDVRGNLVGALTLATGDRGVAEQLAQEALVQAWRHWEGIRTMRDPAGWVFRVGFNHASSWRRRRFAEWRANRRSASGASDHATSEEADAVAVRRAVAQLPERQRSVIVARYYLGYDVAGTAELLGCAPGTVKAATHQAIAKLRASGLVDEGDLPSGGRSTSDEREEHV